MISLRASLADTRKIRTTERICSTAWASAEQIPQSSYHICLLGLNKIIIQQYTQMYLCFNNTQ
jgi:hypothetical protein